MNDRQRKLLCALAKRPCATLGPSDLVDDDYLALVSDGLVQEYWGYGGVHCAVTETGRGVVAADQTVVTNIDGATVHGNKPLSPESRDAVKEIVTAVKARYSD